MGVVIVVVEVIFWVGGVEAVFDVIVYEGEVGFSFEVHPVTMNMRTRTIARKQKIFIKNKFHQI